jgi:hypothetical protein
MKDTGWPSWAITADEVAARTGLDPEAVQRLVDEGRLQVVATSRGGWLTTDTAMARAVAGMHDTASGRRRHRRPSRKAAAGTACTVAGPRRPTPHKSAQVLLEEARARLAHWEREVAAAAARRRPSGSEPVRDQRLTLEAAAELMHVTLPYAVRAARSGLLRATRLGREWVTTLGAVRAYCAAEASPRASSPLTAARPLGAGANPDTVTEAA